MPNIYRQPRIIFPDMSDHHLGDKFQKEDNYYIQPSGARSFISFDASYLNPIDNVIYVSFASKDKNVRWSRVHLWVEPCLSYPRGTKLKFRLFLSSHPYQCIIYVGQYYIIPTSSFSIVTTAGVDGVHRDDMKTVGSGLARFRFYNEFDEMLPAFSGTDLIRPLPIFNGLLEVE